MKKDKNYQLKNSDGYVILISVLIIGAVGVSIGISLLLLGLGFSSSSFSLEQSNQAKGLANACVQTGLQQIRNSSSFSGSGSLTFGQGNCSYDVTIIGSASRLIEAEGIVGNIVRRVKVTTDALNTQINISSWLEVAEF